MSEREVSLTPMMQQYMELRKTVAEDTLLLFRLGDFYELFNKDAEIGSKVLGIVLTHRQNGSNFLRFVAPKNEQPDSLTIFGLVELVKLTN